MRDMKIPMMIQTKGGRKLLDFAKTLPPSAFYISLAFDVENTKLCRQIEPGAPTPQERLDAVKALKGMGHVVYIGWNPCVEEWVVDPVKFAKDI
jgi:DNA repair photolyase